MFDKILLAYDGSDYTEAALRQSADIARMCKAELHIIGITQTMRSAALAEPYAYDFLTTEKTHIEQALKSASKELEGQGLRTTILVREGSPVHEIAAYAEAMKADLVVIGHTDKGLLARWFEGSVGAELIRNLPCSLLIATAE